MINLDDKDISGFIERNRNKLEDTEVIIASADQNDDKSISVTIESGELYYTVWNGETMMERIPFDIEEAWSVFVELYETHIGGIKDDYGFCEDFDFEAECDDANDNLRTAFAEFIASCTNGGETDLTEFEMSELFEDMLELISDRGVKIYRPMVSYENGREIHVEHPYEEGIDVRSYFI